MGDANDKIFNTGVDEATALELNKGPSAGPVIYDTVTWTTNPAQARDILDCIPRNMYEAVMQRAIKLKREKESRPGVGGCYKIGGYKDSGYVGNFVLIKKKLDSIRSMIWGEDDKMPTIDARNDLTFEQYKKLFDHAIDASNYLVFLAEIVAETVKEKFDKDFLEESAEGKEIA